MGLFTSMGHCCSKTPQPEEEIDDKQLSKISKGKKSSFGWAKWARKMGHTEINKDKDRKPMKHQEIVEIEDKNRTYTVVMLRHGESEANQAGICSGWLDAPLTERGMKQAETAG